FATIFIDITDSKNEREELEGFFTVNLDLLCIADVEGNFLKTNEAWGRILGYSTKELDNRKFLEFVHPEDIQATLDAMGRLGEGEEVLNFTNRYRSKDGSYRFIEWRSKPKGRLIYAAARDITDRIQAEESLREERRRLAAIIAGTDVGTWEWNVQTGETVFNERWAEIVGHTLEEISPVSIQTWMGFAHPEDLKAGEEALDRHFRGEAPYYEIESRMRHKLGHWVWVLDRGKVSTRTPEGKPLMMYGTHLDITDRKTAEQTHFRLAEAATELQSCTPDTVDYTGITETARYLSGASYAALNLFDADGGSFTTVAVAGVPHHIRQATDMLGFSLVGRRWNHDPLREAALGDNRTTIFPSLGSLASGSFAASLAEGIARTFGLGEVVITRIMTATGVLGDFTLLFPAGEHLKHRVLLEMFAGMVGVTLARIRTEEQNARLVQEKETLLREVQHRIKNNMSTMTSLLSLQADRVRGTRIAEEILNDVRGRFRSMEILYDRLYRSDVHGVGSLLEYLQALVRQVVDLFPGSAWVKVTVRSTLDECAGDGPCQLDAKRLSTVGLIVNELVTNAMKYAFADDPRRADTDDAAADTPPPTLTVTTACRDEAIEIRVEDNGPGLPDSFDPDNPTGFGITMVQAMVNQLNGTIRYGSSPEPDTHGARVTLIFPR
ncbi:MAG: PAS domain S-box protein, partial [Spirochaetaceae bacterium]